MKNLFKKYERQIIPVDEWVPEEGDKVFKHTKGAIIAPVSQLFGGGENNTGFDYFMVSPKRCYSSLDLREHFTHYLNYFEKFYDEDKELLSVYARIKYLIDFEKGYSKEALTYDINRYILSESLMYKIALMNRDNYKLDLNYSKVKSACLEYNNKHGMIMMKMSVIMITLIPILTHFVYVNKISDVNELLLEFFDKVLHMFDVDIYTKLYETSSSIVERNRQRNPIWNNQDIRGVNPTTHVIGTVNNIILNVMPKYLYSGNLIFLNLSSIENNTKYQVTDIGYECDFIPLSSSNRDEDNNSEFDKFESYLTKQDEALYLQNKVNCEETMRQLEQLYGPFDEDEIKFYKKELMVDGEFVINSFQMELIFNPFYKFFGDPVSIKAINSDDYVKLILITKRMLESNSMIVLPYILSSKITRYVSRKNVNKKELLKLESSPYYSTIMNKYRNEKIEMYILSLIATILSSEFQIIDYHDLELHGKTIECQAEMICDEILMYINLI